MHVVSGASMPNTSSSALSGNINAASVLMANTIPMTDQMVRIAKISTQFLRVDRSLRSYPLGVRLTETMAMYSASDQSRIRHRPKA